MGRKNLRSFSAQSNETAFPSDRLNHAYVPTLVPVGLFMMLTVKTVQEWARMSI